MLRLPRTLDNRRPPPADEIPMCVSPGLSSGMSRQQLGFVAEREALWLRLSSPHQES